MKLLILFYCIYIAHAVGAVVPSWAILLGIATIVLQIIIEIVGATK